MTIRGRMLEERVRIESKFDERERVLRKFTAVIGDGEGNVYPDPSNLQYNFIRRTGRSRIERVRNTRVQAVHGLRVWVGFTPERPDEMQVIDIDDTAYGNALGVGSFLSDHHQQHELHTVGGGGDTTWIWAQQFLHLLCQVTDPISEFLQVRIGIYAYSGAYYIFPGATTVDLTTYAPGAGLAVMVLVSIVAGTGNLVYTTSGPFTSALPSDLWPSQVPVTPDGTLPVGAIYVPNGATTFDWDYVLDWRIFVNVVGDVQPHNIFSTSHPDTLPDTIVRGDLATGLDTVPPRLGRLVHPGTARHLQTDADDVIWNNDITMANGTFIGVDAGDERIGFDAAGFISLQGAQVAIGAAAAVGQLDVIIGNAARAGVIIRGAAAQAANLQEWENSIGTDLAWIRPDGGAVITGNTAIGGVAYSTDRVINIFSTFTGVGAYRGINCIINVDKLAGDATGATSATFTTTIGTAVALTGIQSASNMRVAVDNGIAATITRIIVNRLFADAEDAAVAGTEIIRVEMTDIDTGTIVDSYGIRLLSASIGVGTITNQYGIDIQNISGATNDNYAIRTRAGSVWFNLGRDADTDFIVSGDTELNLLRVDAGEDEVRLGDWNTNYLTTDKNGDTWWVGGGGLIFGHMYVPGVDIIIDITNANPTEVFDDGTTSLGDGWSAGELNLVMFPVGGDEHYLTVPKAGKYEVEWDLSFNMASPGANIEVHGGIMVDGTARRNTGEAHRTIANNSDTGNMGASDIVDCPNGTEQISLWVLNAANNNDVTVVHGNMTIKLIGGT